MPGYRAVLLAFADLIEAAGGADAETRYYAVHSGTTLRCVEAEIHLWAACTTLGGLLNDHRAQLPKGCIDDTLTVVASDGEVKTIVVQECMREMVLLDLTEKNAIGRALL